MCVRWWWWARIDKAKKKKKTSFFTSSFFSYPVTRKKNDVRRNILLLLFVFIIHIQYSISLRLSFYMLVFFRHAHTSKCNIGVIIEHVRQRRRRRRREGRDARAPITHMMRLCTRRFLKNERRRREREEHVEGERRRPKTCMYTRSSPTSYRDLPIIIFFPHHFKAFSNEVICYIKCNIFFNHPLHRQVS